MSIEVMASINGGPWQYATYTEEVEDSSDFTDAQGAVWYRVAAVLTLSGTGAMPPLPPFVGEPAMPFVFVAPDGSEIEGVGWSTDSRWSSRPWWL